MTIPSSIEVLGPCRSGYAAVKIDDKTIELSTMLFKYFIKLAWGLVHPVDPQEPGWVFKGDIDGGYLQTRYIHRLKREMQLHFPEWDVIENNQSGYYRLCAAPQLIGFDWTRIAKFPDSSVLEIVKEATGLEVRVAESLDLAKRKEYQRKYYQEHKEQAKEYQRQYNMTHKKKSRGGQPCLHFRAVREKVKQTFTTSDIMEADPLKASKILNAIMNGERGFVM